MKQYQHILILIYTVIFTSCVVDEQCRENKYVALNAGFYHVDKNQTTGTVTKTTLNINDLTVKGLKFDTVNSKYIYADSVLYKKSNAISKIFLPLHKFESVSKYELTFNALIDTITVSHTNSDEFLSAECGCLKIHSIDSIKTTKHFIDSIGITNHNVNSTNAENIRIYK